MLWVLLLLSFGALLLLPIRVTVDMHHGARRLLRLHVKAAGLTRQWVLEAVRQAGGGTRLIRHKDGTAHPLPTDDSRARAVDSLMRTFRHSKAVRRFLRRHIHPERLDAQVLLHTGSAAATALLTGAVRTAAALLQGRWREVARMRILPDFLHERTTVQARCIFSLRLGTLLITSVLLLAEHAAQAINREAHSLWNTPSES